MSFSADVKNELAKHLPSQVHCQKAELSAMLCYGEASIVTVDGEEKLRFLSENPLIVKKVFTILKKSFNIIASVFFQKTGIKNKSLYGIDIYGTKVVREVLKALRLEKASEGWIKYTGDANRMRSCCRFSFIRGAFLMLGTISDPAKSYHMEFIASGNNDIGLFGRMLADITGEAKTSTRKGSHILYIKDSSIIADVLAAMGASVSLMSYENTRIVNETRGMINRRVNCEVGNLKKAAAAGQKQVQDIELIIEKRGLEYLPDNLKEIAMLRIDNPEASLQELGEMTNPPLGRSGVNHRLQKLLSIAEELKTNQEDRL